MALVLTHATIATVDGEDRVLADQPGRTIGAAAVPSGVIPTIERGQVVVEQGQSRILRRAGHPRSPGTGLRKRPL